MMLMLGCASSPEGLKNNNCLTSGIISYSKDTDREVKREAIAHNIKWCKKCEKLDPRCTEFFKKYPKYRQ